MTARKTPGKAKAVSKQKKVTPSPRPPKASAAKKTTRPTATKQPSMPTAKQTIKPTAHSTAPVNEKETTKLQSPFSAKELGEFYEAMIALRGRLTAQVAGLREQSLMRHDEVNQYEDGTDAFDRVTSLDYASGGQSQINQINTAIRMIEEGTYGICEHCSEKIEKRRLQALPFIKSCIKCQSQMEGGSVHQRRSIDLLG